MLESAIKQLIEKGSTDANDANALGTRATDGKRPHNIWSKGELYYCIWQKIIQTLILYWLACASLGSPVPCKDGKHSTHTCNLISCKFTIRNPTDVFSQELPPHLHVGFSNLLSSNPIEIHVPDSCHTVTTETSSPTSTAFNSTCPEWSMIPWKNIYY